MGETVKIYSEIRLVLTIIAILFFITAALQIADAPPSEAVNPDDVQCYRIDDSGRITDSAGRLRGWMKGNEIYGSDLDLLYRLSGSRVQRVQ